MPPDLGLPYQPSWLGRPAHMAEQDLLLWERARPTFAPLVSSWYFDAAVGEGSGIPADPGNPIDMGFYRLTRKRIDAVGDAGSKWILIEVRPNAGLGALGAIQTYRSLWERDPPDTRPVEAYIITDRLEEDTLATAVNANIRVHQV